MNEKKDSELEIKQNESIDNKLVIKDNNKTFQNLNLKQWLIDQCLKLAIKSPTPVQTECIPEILKGNDVIAIAETGSGKTATFVLPILHQLFQDPYGIYALILTPTRELAYQISQQFKSLGRSASIRVCLITGGQDLAKESRELLTKPHIVVSTPGRMAHHIESKNIILNKIKFLVMDEADRLLEDNFNSQIEQIFKVIPENRQTLLFSATSTNVLKSLPSSSNRKPFVYGLDTQPTTVTELDQRYIFMPANMKDAVLFSLIDKFEQKNPYSLIMVFTNTCKYCQVLKMVAMNVGLKCVCIHSLMKQKDRIDSLNRFKSNIVKILFATDVASRGLDIPAIDLVVNHNVPTRAKDYVHRVGRTARAGRVGSAITLVNQFEVNLLHSIEDSIGKKLIEKKANNDEILKILTEITVLKRGSEIKLEEIEFGDKRKKKRKIV
ncbi:hypothetical protein A3Q56_03954 [Intoshia linei]|uniref:RNA helicase n=1 Tax=Intoshia linei TaxID=1819745 RepID=A0A177B218_9BILA|nr:hypothetical protein A3Q56_03954 [Intoshia linei]